MRKVMEVQSLYLYHLHHLHHCISAPDTQSMLASFP